MILLFVFGFLALAAAMDRHRGWLPAVGTVRARLLSRITGWLALSFGSIACLAGHGWAMGLIRTVALATPAAVLVLLLATYIRVPPRGSPNIRTGR